MDTIQSESITQAANEALATIGIEDDSKAEVLAQLITDAEFHSGKRRCRTVTR